MPDSIFGAERQYRRRNCELSVGCGLDGSALGPLQANLFAAPRDRNRALVVLPNGEVVGVGRIVAIRRTALHASNYKYWFTFLGDILFFIASP
jgi:hypothetical protein